MRRFILSLTALLTASSSASLAIMIRHDREDARYLALGAKFPMVGRLGGSVESTLIAPRWVITAAHAVERSGPFDAPLQVAFGEQTYKVERIIIHPKRVYRAVDAAGDMALLRLTLPVHGVTPAALYEKSDEAGRTITVVGRGTTGTGVTGPVEEKGHALRGATNVVDKADGDVLSWSFDAPPGGTELEGISGPGDSGGPAFLEQDGKVYLLGVSSTNSGDSENTMCRYGTIEAYARISTSREWITQTLLTSPPSTVEWTAVQNITGLDGLPATPVGRLMSDFLRAFNRASVEEITEVLARHRDQSRPAPSPEARARSMDTWRGMIRQYGTYEVRAFAAAGPRRMRALAYSSATKAWRYIALEVDAGDPARIKDFYFRDSSPPPEQK